MLDSDHRGSRPEPVSRESEMHLALYDAFPQVGGVIHAHAPNLMVFAASGCTMPPVMEYTEKFGAIGLRTSSQSYPRIRGEVVTYMRGLWLSSTSTPWARCSPVTVSW